MNGYAIIREVKTSSTVIGVLKVARGFFAAHSRCTTETIAKLLMRQAIGLDVAQDRDREQCRRPHRPIGLLELTGDCRASKSTIHDRITIRIDASGQRSGVF
jgi:hypothetical protein